MSIIGLSVLVNNIREQIKKSNRKVHYKLMKDNFYKGRLIFDEQDIIEMLKPFEVKGYYYNKDLACFENDIDRLRDYVGDQRFSRMTYNLATLKVFKLPWYDYLNCSGRHYGSSNVIKSRKKALSHELLHCVSCIYDEMKGILLSGFLQCHIEGDSRMGDGINEGYTELLNARIFNNGKANSYHIQVKIAQIIELMVGNQKEMEYMYFNNDLPKLVKKLEKYATREEVIALLRKMDNATIKSDVLESVIELYKIQLTLNKWVQKSEVGEIAKNRVSNIANSNPIIRLINTRKEVKLNRESLIRRTDNDQLEILKGKSA